MIDQAKSGDWPAIEALLASNPPRASYVSYAVFWAGTAEVRAGLIAYLRALETSGWHEVHLEAMAGDVDALAQRPASDLELKARVDQMSWTPLQVAAAAGQGPAIAALLDRGADLDACTIPDYFRALELAIRYEHEDVVKLLLARGAKPAAVTGRVVRPQTMSLLPDLQEAGFDVNASEWLLLNVGYDNVDNDVRAAWLCELLGAGLKLDADKAFSLLSALKRDNPEEVPRFLALICERSTIDFRGDVGPGGSTAPQPWLAWAAADWPASTLQQLLDAGAPLCVVRVQAHWLDADAKRTWFAERGAAGGVPDLAEFVTLTDSLLTPEMLVSVLVGEGMSVGGLSLGQSATIDEFNYSYSKSEENAARHQLIVPRDGELVRAVNYEVWYREDAGGKERAAAAFQALGDAYSEALGKKGRGKKSQTWRRDGAVLKLAQLTRRGAPGEKDYIVTLELYPPNS